MNTCNKYSPIQIAYMYRLKYILLMRANIRDPFRIINLRHIDRSQNEIAMSHAQHLGYDKLLHLKTYGIPRYH